VNIQRFYIPIGPGEEANPHQDGAWVLYQDAKDYYDGAMTAMQMEVDELKAKIDDAWNLGA
jgi:hypothetical protein